MPAAAIDANGHVNNVEYVRWMQEAAISHADASGCTAATQAAGASWVVRTHHVEYLRPAWEGEALLIVTWVATAERVRSRRGYLFYREGERELLARGETEWVFIDAETGRPKSIPTEVAGCFTLRESEPEEGDIFEG